LDRIKAYHQKVKARLIADPLILEFEIIRETQTSDEGHLRARLILHNGERLELSEYVRLEEDIINVVTYSFHWSDAEEKLVFRWDNAPHYTKLPNYPHHIHDGITNEVTPGKPVMIDDVLDEIYRIKEKRIHD
jgi:hypothetical protein